VNVSTPSNEDVEKQTAALIHYGAMCREIAACVRIDEVKEIRDKAMALAVYAKQALNRDAEKHAAEIRLRAEIRAGAILKEMREKGERDRGGRSDRKESKRPILSDLGVSPDQSSQWQQLAEIPKREVEAYIRESAIPTANGLLNSQKADSANGDLQKVDPVGLWVWGRLKDFERDGIMAVDAKDLFDDLPITMREDISRLAPKVSQWLNQFPKKRSA
jgi:hypothetical protein